MMIIIIAGALGSLSCAGFCWFIFSTMKTKSLQEERVREIQTQKALALDKTPNDSAVSKFSKDRRRKKRHDDAAIFFVMLGSLPLSAIWFLADPQFFVIKYVFSALVLLIGLRAMRIIQKIKYRQEIEERLPVVLDLLVVCIEAGMSINSSLIRCAEEMKGTALSSELRNTFYEMEVGLPLDEAFRNLGSRTGVEDVQSLATSIIQGEKLGIALGDTLRNQAKFVRESLRAKTKERILKTPVKIILPLVFCIFPCLFVVLLSPAFIQIKQEIIDKNKPTQQSAAPETYSSQR